MSRLMRLLRDESGATAIEYGLIAACISIAIIAAATTVGTNLNTTFTNVSTGPVDDMSRQTRRDFEYRLVVDHTFVSLQ